MIELAMIFGLGFLLASLVWLTILPVLARRAFRLAERRLRRQMPTSMAEIAAERDHLRARHAVAVRQLEQAGEALQARVARLMSELGREATRLVRTTEKNVAAQAEIGELQEELAQTTLALFEAQGTLGTQMVMLHDALGMADRRLAMFNGVAARLAAAEGTIDEQRATIAGLETRSTGHDLRLRTALTEAARMIERLKAADKRIEQMSGDLDIARADVALMTARRDSLQARVEELLAALTQSQIETETERGRSAGKATDIGLQTDAIAGLTARVATQERQIDETRQQLSDTQAQRASIQAERDRLIEFQSRINEILSRDWGDVDVSALFQLQATPAGEGDDLSVLRATISSLAADLVRHATAAESTSAAPTSGRGG